MAEETPWERFGAAVLRTRTEMGWGYREAAKRAKIGEQTWLNCEHGKPLTVRTIASIERVFSWPAGTADRIIYEAESVDVRLAALEKLVGELTASVDALLTKAGGAAGREARAKARTRR